MGLFTKKDPCAVCGGKVKGLLPWKIDEHLICNSCFEYLDLPVDTANRMTFQDLQEYLGFRKENAQLSKTFQITEQVDLGWLSTSFLFDMTNGFLCMDKELNKTIFEAKHIESFTIREDSALLFEGNSNGLVCYPSSVPDRALAMAPQIRNFRMQKAIQHNPERQGKDGAPPAPYFDIPEPFQKFNIEIRFSHPYRSSYTATMDGPIFNNSYPDVNDYLREYNERFAVLERLARALAELAFSGEPKPVETAPEPAPAPAAAAVDVVTELKRFKELVDQGILTEEEFTAKKRQLLGI